MGSEILQFAGAMVFLIAILIGSYWFVYAPTRRKRRDSEDNG